MSLVKGRNQNLNDEARVDVVNVTSVSSVVIAPANPDRIAFTVCLAHGASNEDVYIRLYPSADDNDLKGITLSRRLSGNDNLDNTRWEMSTDNVYTGEISAISVSGDVDVSVTEY